jgi:hypothetical protein
VAKSEIDSSIVYVLLPISDLVSVCVLLLSPHVASNAQFRYSGFRCPGMPCISSTATEPLFLCLISHNLFFHPSTIISSSLFLLWVVPPPKSISLLRSISTTSSSTGSRAKVRLERFVGCLPTCFYCFSTNPTQVRVVEHKRTKKLYALKYIDKHQCIKQKSVPNIIQERRLLEEVRILSVPCSLPHRPSTGGPPLLGQPPLCIPGRRQLLLRA